MVGQVRVLKGGLVSEVVIPSRTGFVLLSKGVSLLTDWYSHGALGGEGSSRKASNNKNMVLMVLKCRELIGLFDMYQMIRWHAVSCLRFEEYYCVVQEDDDVRDLTTQIATLIGLFWFQYVNKNWNMEVATDFKSNQKSWS